MQSWLGVDCPHAKASQTGISAQCPSDGLTLQQDFKMPGAMCQSKIFCCCERQLCLSMQGS